MTPDSWQIVRSRFLDAANLDAAARHSFLDSLRASEPAVAHEVELMLTLDDSPDSSLDSVPNVLGLATAASPSPQQIGRYEVLGVLGEGRAGIVYHACQRDSDREVALKLLRAAVWSKHAAHRFRTEIRALALLRHPHIARLYDAGTLPEPGGAARPYFAMELVRGPNILQFVVAHPEADLATVVGLFLQVCDGIAEAHRYGVIHRDLKPANILVDVESPTAYSHDDNSHPMSAPPCVKVIDFGIARLLDSDHHDTLTGQILGTPGYMSPEQLSGQTSQADTRADVYAAGTILRELLDEHAARSATPPRRSRDVDVILATATQREPERRYQSISDLAEDLRRLLSHRPILARAPSVRYRLFKFAQRSPALAGSLLAAAALCMALATSLYIGKLRAQEASDRTGHLASLMLNELIKPSEDRIGMSADRTALLLQLLPTIESHARSLPSNTQSQSDYAAFLGALGDAMEEQGNHAEAISYLTKALGVRELIASLTPDDPRALMALSTANVRVGDLAERGNSAIPRELWYRRAMAIDERILHQHPSDPWALSNCAFGYERLAALALGQEQFSEAMRLSSLQIETSTRLLKIEPASERALWGMSSAWGTRAEVLIKRRCVSEAAAATRLEIDSLRFQMLHFPASERIPKRLASALLSLSELLAVAGEKNFRQSEINATEAVEISGAVHRQDVSELDATILYGRALCIQTLARARVGDNVNVKESIGSVLQLAARARQRCNDCPEATKFENWVRYFALRSSFSPRSDALNEPAPRSLLSDLRALETPQPLTEQGYRLAILLLELPNASDSEKELYLQFARSFVSNHPAPSIPERLTLAKALACSGKDAEAANAFAQTLRAIPEGEVALREGVQKEYDEWKLAWAQRPSR